jgi:N-acetylglutamate synthase-like GNAT family acetyltransferase
MDNSSLWIRHANEADVPNIYRLQFNEGWLLSASEVARNLQQLYVMEKEARLIGVHLAAQNRAPLYAPAVHPLFPQKTVEEMLLRGVHLLETGGQ